MGPFFYVYLITVATLKIRQVNDKEGKENEEEGNVLESSESVKKDEKNESVLQ